MRFTAFVLLLTSSSFAQTLTEFGAAAAAGTVGGVSGKQVSDGLTKIFEKVETQTAKAANKKQKATEPALKAGPGVATGVATGLATMDTGDVPPPPRIVRSGLTPPQLPLTAYAALPTDVAQTTAQVFLAPALPPPPEMSPEDLKTVSAGMNRADVLKFGAPASRITMFDKGHLSETYSYRQNGQKIGTVRLSDGAVASVEVQ